MCNPEKEEREGKLKGRQERETENRKEETGCSTNKRGRRRKSKQREKEENQGHQPFPKGGMKFKRTPLRKQKWRVGVLQEEGGRKKLNILLLNFKPPV